MITYSSYKHRRDEELLRCLGRAIFVLKLQAQQRLDDHGLSLQDAQTQRDVLDAVLSDLGRVIQFRADGSADARLDLTFLNLADRIVKDNLGGVQDRLAQITGVRERIRSGECLSAREFRLLDYLHRFLEEEASEGIQGLFRL